MRFLSKLQMSNPQSNPITKPFAVKDDDSRCVYNSRWIEWEEDVIWKQLMSLLMFSPNTLIPQPLCAHNLIRWYNHICYFNIVIFWHIQVPVVEENQTAKNIHKPNPHPKDNSLPQPALRSNALIVSIPKSCIEYILLILKLDMDVIWANIVQIRLGWSIWSPPAIFFDSHFPFNPPSWSECHPLHSVLLVVQMSGISKP